MVDAQRFHHRLNVQNYFKNNIMKSKTTKGRLLSHLLAFPIFLLFFEENRGKHASLA